MSFFSAGVMLRAFPSQLRPHVWSHFALLVDTGPDLAETTLKLVDTTPELGQIQPFDGQIQTKPDLMEPGFR